MIRPTRRARIMAGLGLAMIMACSPGSGPAANQTGTPTSSAPPTAPTPRVHGTIDAKPFGAGSLVNDPCGLAASPTEVWILSCSGRLVRVPKAGKTGSSQRLEGEVLALDGLVAQGYRVWALLAKKVDENRRLGRVVVFDRPSGRVRATVDLDTSVPMSAAAIGATLWIGALDGALYSLEGGTPTERGRGPALTLVAAEGEALWTVRESGDVVLLDPRSASARRTFERVAPGAIAAAAAFGSAWVWSPDAGLLSMSATDDRPRRIPSSGTINEMEPCGGAVWLSAPDDGVRAVSAAGEAVASVTGTKGSRYLTCDGETLWILSEDGRLSSASVG